jgi:hypothetical protein
MSYKGMTLMPQRRVKRILERRRDGTPRMKAAPLLSRPMRVVVRLQPNSEAGEELLFLGALEELKRRHDRIDLEYVTSNLQVAALLKGNWFLKTVTYLQDHREFDEVVGEDFSVTLFEPDPQAAAIAEEDRFKTNFQAEVEAKQYLQQMYQDQGMKDLVVEMPVYHFQAKWSKTNAYLWTVSDRLGIHVDIPFEAIPPYGEVPKEIRRKSLAAAGKEHITSQPFGIYDVRGEQNEIVLAGVIGKTLDPLRMFSVQELEKAVGSDISLQMGVFQSPNCEFVVAPVGDLLYAAWAAGVPNILTIYQGANPNWDGVHPVNGLPMYRDHFEDDKLPQAFYQNLKYMVDKANE